MLKHGGLAKAGVDFYPAAFRRLCVETIISYVGFDALMTSRLQAAVC